MAIWLMFSAALAGEWGLCCLETDPKTLRLNLKNFIIPNNNNKAQCFLKRSVYYLFMMSKY